MLNAELHGIRAGTWPAGEAKERRAEKKARNLWNAAIRQ